MPSELSHTLQSLSERVNAVADQDDADAIQIEIDQTWVQNDDDERIIAMLDNMTMRLAAKMEQLNG